MSGRTTVTCERCGDERDAAEHDEYGHVCDDWWDEHGIFDALPTQHFEFHPESTGSESDG
jgi:hypothetical protein